MSNVLRERPMIDVSDISAEKRSSEHCYSVEIGGDSHGQKYRLRMCWNPNCVERHWHLEMALYGFWYGGHKLSYLVKAGEA